MMGIQASHLTNLDAQSLAVVHQSDSRLVQKPGLKGNKKRKLNRRKNSSSVRGKPQRTRNTQSKEQVHIVQPMIISLTVQAEKEREETERQEQ